ncbi:hypothetical protein D6D01_02675 [Aureobasidium pullulans]|uniref:Pal1-domain-containing protein n=1 Tax=Aureobasidium pullulans TaxID=5580 RepID=A0A4S9LQU5_AURPU|nr:hypothetical protein D6D01_02675 [Aureobasidium pullulans]
MRTKLNYIMAAVNAKEVRSGYTPRVQADPLTIYPQAQAYLIDPLNAPEPSQETGPGTHFYPPDAPKAASPTVSSPSSSKNPFRDSKSGATTHVRHSSRSSTGSTSKFPDFQEGPSHRRNISGEHRRNVSGDHLMGESSAGRRRGSSLNQRYPGDTSNQPLNMLRKDSKKAYRSPHLNKRHIPGADTIDRLDPTPNKLPYHHEGPYDAALLARNTSYKTSPIAALEDSNREALKATPAENIKDALDKHRPLDGVASVPPGQRDQLGRVYHYEEGTDMMREANPEGGAYKQWPGEEYHPDDLKGKGEPAFSLDRALKAHTIHERDFDGQRGIELSDRPLMSDYDKQKDRKKLDNRDPVEIAGDDSRYADLVMAADSDAHTQMNRTSSLRKAGEGLKKRLSLRRRHQE